MNWDDVSDKAINKAVAEKTGWTVLPDQYNQDEVVAINKYGFEENLDYCNSWSDMGPIIYQHSISLVLDGDHNTAVKNFECFNGEGGGFTGDYEHEHTNPLRAAVIVYLMMNGVKPDNLT